ncbi:enoyl-CoA hydratase/isomerase family protein [Taklimakanibacter lacteus]|uniref:enoyl-CoA hydratase/isomerase family protein n=1 Tax=Taklimakanibacter lacteus TaxID=2268456 RepID=UPI000E666B8F
MTRTVLSEYLGDGVQQISLNRPHRLNAIVPELLEDLIAALDAANEDARVGAIVLTGEGRAFCAGDDLKEFSSQAGNEAETTAYIERIQDVTRSMMFGDRPVIGAIRGWACGGGLEWVINCDFAIAAEGTRFFFPEIALGVFVTGGVTDILPRLVGLQRAREMIMLGDKFDATQAKCWGLIRDVVPDEQLLPSARDLARRIAALPRERVRDLRHILARRTGAGLDAAMAQETQATVKGFLDPDSAKRVAQFR